MDEEFRQYCKENNRNYTSTTEYEYRKKIYEENRDLINEERKKGKILLGSSQYPTKSYKKKINSFCDLSVNEFEAYFLLASDIVEKALAYNRNKFGRFYIQTTNGNALNLLRFGIQNLFSRKSTYVAPRLL